MWPPFLLRFPSLCYKTRREGSAGVSDVEYRSPPLSLITVLRVAVSVHVPIVHGFRLNGLQPKMDGRWWIGNPASSLSGGTRRVCGTPWAVLSPARTAVTRPRVGSLLALTSPPLPQCFLRPFLKLFALGSLAQGLLLGETQPETSVPKLPSPHSQAGSCLSSSHPVPGRHGGSARGGRLVPASYLLCKLPWLGGWWAFPVPSLAFPPREPKRSLL